MAQVRILTWNIQVYGPNKYGRSVNGPQLVNLVGAVLNNAQADILVIQETMSSVGDQVAFSLTEAIENATGQNWAFFRTQCRVGGDRESYGIFWRTGGGVQFARAADAAGVPVQGLATLEFPNNFSDSNGRRAAYVTFTTTDTNRNFTVTAYHAPPNARAIRGLRQLAGMAELYTVANAHLGPAGAAVPARLLCGDYNLDVTVQPDYTWLTNPVPVPPPPNQAGEGAGCVGATTAATQLASYGEAVTAWGPPVAGWSANPVDYRHALSIDNVFYATPAAAPHGGSVADVIAAITLPGSPIRLAAEAFARAEPLGGETFPHALTIPLPFSTSLTVAANAFLFYRYAVSDHLPVFASLAI